MLSRVVEGDHLRLSLPNERAALEPTRLAVADFLAAYAPSEALRYQVELVIEEMLMNVIWHAFDDAVPHRIGLALRVEPAQVVLDFDDDGVAFDPLRAPLPEPPVAIEAAVPGGLGLLLVRRMARAMTYERRDGRNRLTVTLARDPARAGP